MVFHAFHVLVRFMSLSSHENHVALLRHHGGGADGFASVNDADHLLFLFLVESRQHVVDDVLRFFEARVVARDDHAVTAVGSFACHERPFSLVAIAARSADGDDLPISFDNVVDGRQHVGQGIGRVGIVDDCAEALWRADGLKTAVDRMQFGEHAQHLRWLVSEADGRPVDRQKV